MEEPRGSGSRSRDILAQVGHCGIWCGSCAVGTGALMDLAHRYRELVESHGLGEWGASEFDYRQFVKALEAIARLTGCPGCLRGGGRDDCEIRRCAVGRGLELCVECAEGRRCPEGKVLNHMRIGARRAGLSVVENREDKDRLLRECDSELRTRWWWRALTSDDNEQT